MVRRRKLLIIEDEEALLRGLVDEFTSYGFEVDYSWDGSEGLRKAKRNDYDLILLDLMLPQVDGYDICEQIRLEDRETPIVILTAKDSTEDLIHGLQLGADDYITKPFSVKALVLKVQAILRRAGRLPEKELKLQIGELLLIDTLHLRGTRSNETILGIAAEKDIAFTRREMEILEYLAQHSHRPISRGELLREIWGYPQGKRVQTRTVDIHIAKLRKKIEPSPKEPQFLVTVRGRGYKLLETQAV